jgi:hypothetical protein
MKPAAYISHSLALAFLAVILLSTSHSLIASSNEQLIYSFQPENQSPSTALVSDQAGNLYGATFGTNNTGNIYKLSPIQGAVRCINWLHDSKCHVP